LIPETEQKEKKPRLTELFAFVGVIVSIIIAGTTLWNYSANVPSWWFIASFLILFVLTFLTIIMFVFEPLSKRIRSYRLKRKKDKIAKKYFSEFLDLAETFRKSIYPLFYALQELRGHVEPEIKMKMGNLPTRLMQPHQRTDVENPLNTLKKRFGESKRTFRELILLTDNFNTIISINQKNLKLFCEYYREAKKDYTIHENVERQYEEYREKYNAFLRDFRKTCHKINEEIGETTLPEYAGDFANKL
jgi:hypothetical protein